MDTWLKVVLGAVTLGVLISSNSGPSKSPRETSLDRRAAICGAGGESDAFYMSQEFVTRRLKAPATAEFPYRSDRGVAVRHLGSCKFEVVAHVDAQNGFGALLRLPYVVSLEYRPASDDWKAEAVLLE